MKKALIPIVILIFVVAILVASVLWFVYVQNQQAKEADLLAAEGQISMEGYEEEQSAAKKKAKDDYAYFFSPGESFVCNAAQSACFVKATLTILINEKKQEEFLTKETTVIRDRIIKILRSKTEEELRAVDIQDTLSSEICTALNEYYGVSYFKQAYFSELIVQ